MNISKKNNNYGSLIHTMNDYLNSRIYSSEDGLMVNLLAVWLGFVINDLLRVNIYYALCPLGLALAIILFIGASRKIISEEKPTAELLIQTAIMWAISALVAGVTGTASIIGLNSLEKPLQVWVLLLVCVAWFSLFLIDHWQILRAHIKKVKV